MIGLALAAAMSAPTAWDWPSPGPMPPLAEDFLTVCAWPTADPDWSPRRADGQGYLAVSPDSAKVALAKTVEGEVWTVILERHVEAATADLPEHVVRSCTVTGSDPDDASLAFRRAWAADGKTTGPLAIRFKETPKTGALIPVADEPSALRDALQTQGLIRLDLSRSGKRSVFKASFAYDPKTARPSRPVKEPTR